MHSRTRFSLGNFKMATCQRKRFKSCKLRVRSVSTHGKKTTRKVTLKLSPSKENKLDSKCVSSSATGERSFAPALNDTCDNSDVELDEIPTSYQKRRLKEYESWKELRESLLHGRIEEEGFLHEEKCSYCGLADVEVRCVDCGYDRYFCGSCANKTHKIRITSMS